MQCQIKNRFTGEVAYECELSAEISGKSYSLQLGFAVKKAVEARANLTGVNLAGVNLTDANLTGVNLARANLARANLTGVNLTGVNLTDANLTGVNLARANLTGVNLARANLAGVNLTGANLARANLTGVNLARANLTGVNLTGVNLTGANLARANLTDARNDFWDVLLRAQGEVPGLLAAVREGRVDGSTYEGACACLVGTIANVRHAEYDDLGNGLDPNSSRPIEQFFLAIKKGDTPDTSPVSKIVEGWIVEFQSLTAHAGAVR